MRTATGTKEETFANELKEFIEVASRSTKVFLTKLSDNEFTLGLLGNKRIAKVTVVDGKFATSIKGKNTIKGSLSDSKLVDLENDLISYMKWGW